MCYQQKYDVDIVMRIFINVRKNKVAAAFDLKILSFTSK